MQIPSMRTGVARQVGTEKGAGAPALWRWLPSRSLAAALFACAAALAMVLLGQPVAASFVTAPV
ncbi:MAG TPA: hypothetical protein VKU02_27265, partial [Gemmataceae bacterium]|nr:hypothetical protein [Gemmataceae bacterium]